MTSKRKVELLSPAGSMDKLRVAYRFGADAVYVGGKAFNLRARSSNFSNSELKTAVAYAHARKKRIYVALNIIAHDRELKAMPKFIAFLNELKIDGVIVADLGVMELVASESDIPIHISTQASSTNWRSVRMWQKLGAKRVVLAREVSIDEIKKIKDAVPDMQVEAFIHGSMCMTYSGRCNLSSYFAERDGNRGVCSNTCRWKFHIVEEKRPGEYFPVYEDENGSHIYNSKDLCSIEFLEQLLDAGVDALKIEGRMKSVLYNAVTTKVYRQALASYLNGTYSFQQEWLDELQSYSHRGYTSGFYLGGLDKGSENRAGGYQQTHKFLGLVTKNLGSGGYLVTVYEKLKLGDSIEIFTPHNSTASVQIESILDPATGSALAVVQPNTSVRLNLPAYTQENDVLRIKLPPTQDIQCETQKPFDRVHAESMAAVTP